MRDGNLFILVAHWETFWMDWHFENRHKDRQMEWREALTIDDLHVCATLRQESYVLMFIDIMFEGT
jgi:hypothetical protein